MKKTLLSQSNSLHKVTLKMCKGKTRFCCELNVFSHSSFSNFITTQRHKSCQSSTKWFYWYACSFWRLQTTARLWLFWCTKYKCFTNLHGLNEVTHVLAGSGAGDQTQSAALSHRSPFMAIFAVCCQSFELHSAAEYCAPVRSHSAHIGLIDVQLNATMWLISGTLCPIPLRWLPVLANIESPPFRRKAASASAKLVKKAVAHDSWPIHCDIFYPLPQQLSSKSQPWQDSYSTDITSQWRKDWNSALVVNSHLVVDPTTW